MTAGSPGRAPLIALYPGTFDPTTLGHMHLIRRASRVADRLVISVFAGSRKKPLFSLEERVAMVRADIALVENMGCPIEVTGFSGLLVRHAREVGASCVVRGLRAVSDFEYEFKMTGMNARLDPGIETLFLAAPARWQFVSSTFVREIASLGGDVSRFVTRATAQRLAEKFRV
ncbi:MAG TPA: pantetheine-phosphate adenylyltransferase [Rhodospirillaceae bacterium]|jgi:pantetheine-phosphate adenylyltransferase|nr:pantetheine-phosphate adenylyltransferase [Alphaproteobacteria bacterium]HBH26766.1 pantetheine-phosphate adenylyltransferase [Rhodospirillaceae bacterium]